VPVSGEDFLRIFENKSDSYSDGEEYEDDYYKEPQKKGSPRKLSKKEKAIRRTLKKL
jgi:hypothetical protein